MPTAIRSWQGGKEEKEEEKDEKLRRAMLKSNNPHLAGGEKCEFLQVVNIFSTIDSQKNM